MNDNNEVKPVTPNKSIDHHGTATATLVTSNDEPSTSASTNTNQTTTNSTEQAASSSTSAGAASDSTVVNETQTTPDAGTGGNAQTEDVGQVPMSSTANATTSTPLPNTLQVEAASKVMADALNKELGNDVASMVDPTMSALQTTPTTASVAQALPDMPIPTALGAALAQAGVVTPEEAAAAAQTTETNNDAPSNVVQTTDETVVPASDVPAADSSADGTSTADSGVSSSESVVPGTQNNPESTTDLQSQPVEGDTHADDSNGTAVPNGGGSADQTQSTDSTNAGSQTAGTDGSNESPASVSTDSEGSTASNGVDPGYQPSTESQTSGDSQSEGSSPSGSDEGVTQGTDAASLTLGADSAGNAPGASPTNPDASTALPQSTPNEPQSPTKEDIVSGQSDSVSDASTPSSGTNDSSTDGNLDGVENSVNASSAAPDEAAHVDTTTGAPTVTNPSTEVEETATSTPATEVPSTPAADAPADPVKPTPSDDVNAPVPPNTQTSDSVGPAATLPSTPDPVSADNTTATSVDSPNPQQENTQESAASPVAGNAGSPSVADVTQESPAPEVTQNVAPVVVNTGVNDTSNINPPTSTNMPAIQSDPSTTQTPVATDEPQASEPTSHGPTGIAEVDRVLEHVPAAALGPILAIKNYMNMMAPRKPMDPKTGAQHQVSLFRAMTNIINREEEHFESLFTAMLKMFEHGKDTVFQEAHVFRFQESINLNADEQKGFQRLVNLFKVMGPVQDRPLARKQVRVEESLTHGVTDEGRSRVLSYFDPNGR